MNRVPGTPVVCALLAAKGPSHRDQFDSTIVDNAAEDTSVECDTLFERALVHLPDPGPPTGQRR